MRFFQATVGKKQIKKLLSEALLSLSTLISENSLCGGVEFISRFCAFFVELFVQAALPLSFVWYGGNLRVSSD